ncbi:hypothetical protein IMZ48_11995 [Candidatus Bathyarchaeota archaeon]|nr:hypothetical protein [Candidatus Bathyarchaeota archaeon]
MAAASTALRLCARALARPRPTPALHSTRPLLHRALTTTVLRWRSANTPDDGEEEPAEEYDFVGSMLADVPEEERTAEMEAEMQQLGSQLEKQEADMHRGLDEESDALFKEPRPQRDSFWFDEEDDDPATADIEGEDFDEDDIPTMAHGKLDELREHRHYARIVAWEMPMLASTLSPASPFCFRSLLCIRITNEGDQNSQSPSSPPGTTRSSATATRPTSASPTPRSARSS